MPKSLYLATNLPVILTLTKVQQSGCNRKSALKWQASNRKITLQGIIEADETYVGGKPRKPNKRGG